MNHSEKFATCCKAMAALEAEARDAMGGRHYALSGAWSHDRERLRDFLRRWSFNANVPDDQFAGAVEAWLRGFLNVGVTGPPPQKFQHLAARFSPARDESATGAGTPGGEYTAGFPGQDSPACELASSASTCAPPVFLDHEGAPSSL
jgi:hypothetical protein